MNLLDKQLIMKSFTQPDDKFFLAKTLDQAYLCIKSRDKTFTEFMDPLRAGKILSAIGDTRKYGMVASVFGGQSDAERVMIGFAPDYEVLEDSDFPITLIRAAYNTKFSSGLSHRDFLGSVLGLGIDRGKIGDIVMLYDSAVIVVDSSIAFFVEANLEKVGNAKVKLSVCAVDDEFFALNNQQEEKMTIASMRVDNIVSGAFNISRSKAADMIAGDKVFVNWSCVSNASKILAEGDIVTLRGSGRIKIKEVLGKTKKDRFLIQVIKY